MVKGAWAEAIAALDREAGRVGLGTDDDQPSAAGAATAARTGSVWPVLGFGFLVIALIADRVHSSHAVPVRWLIVLLVLGLVVVAGQLREGGRLPALNGVPAVIGSPVLLTSFALLLAAQQADFLSLGVTQVAWFLALVCVLVPVLREARRSRPPAATTAAPTLTVLRQSAPLFGAVLTVVAIIVGWLPGQYGPGWFWTVVLLLAAAVAVVAETAKLPANRVSLPAPVAAAGFWVLTALVIGVAVASARLQVTSLLWVVAAYVLGREAWRRLAAEGGPIELRSRVGIAVVALGIAVLSLFGTTNSISSSGYFVGGLSYDPYAYNADSGGYAYNPTEYYQPGFYYEGSGRGQPYSIPVVAGLVAMAGVVRRRRMTKQLRIGAAMVAAGALLWAGIEGSLSYISVWVFVIAVIVAALATALTSWPRRFSVSSPPPS
ncbi:MAG: hypothetical protein QOC82_2444 [Frankiaceae bacterium]|nr:hypothetical protein [Frankiaceae bacterium]